MSETTEEVNGVPGQIVYPDPTVDAERAAAFAGGKVDTLVEGVEASSIQQDYDKFPREEAGGEPEGDEADDE
jgi:hypothetical protein